MTADNLLAAMKAYAEAESLTPAGARVVVREADGDAGAVTVLLDADDEQEHETLRGMMTITGSVCLDVSLDDTTSAERGEMLHNLRLLYGLNEFLDFANDPGEDRGLPVYSEGLHVYDLRLSGGTWERSDRRTVGKIEFSAVAAEVDRVGGFKADRA